MRQVVDGDGLPPTSNDRALSLLLVVQCVPVVTTGGDLVVRRPACMPVTATDTVVTVIRLQRAKEVACRSVSGTSESYVRLPVITVALSYSSTSIWSVQHDSGSLEPSFQAIPK
jgi:hypothetical protein